MKKKRPYYLFAWILMEAVFFLTVAIVALFIVLNSIAGSTSGSTTIFSTWYQTLLFFVDVLCLGGAVTLFVLDVKQRKKPLNEKEGDSHDEKVL